MVVSNSPHSLPLEIWHNIIQYSSVNDCKQIAKVSHDLRKEVQLKLYNTLIFDERGSPGCIRIEPPDVEGTYVRNLRLFVSRHQEQRRWLPLVRNVHLYWTDEEVEADVFNYDSAPGLGGSVAMQRRDKTQLESIRAIESYFEATDLVNLHLTLPGAEVPAATNARIESLNVGCKEDLSEATDYEKLKNIMRLPHLQHLEIRSLQASSVKIGGSNDQHAFSCATSLQLTDCAPIYPELSHIFRWPSNLQSLKIYMHKEDPGWFSDDDIFSVQEMIHALSGLSSTLQELELLLGDPGNYGHEDFQSYAFSNFSRLRRLVLSADIVVRSTYSMDSTDDHNFHTNFPPSIENLTLVFESTGIYNEMLEGFLVGEAMITVDVTPEDVKEVDCLCHDYKHRVESSHVLFEELMQLSEYKAELPNLSHLQLLRNGVQWLDCAGLRRYTDVLEKSGIAVTVREREDYL